MEIVLTLHFPPSLQLFRAQRPRRFYFGFLLFLFFFFYCKVSLLSYSELDFLRTSAIPREPGPPDGHNEYPPFVMRPVLLDSLWQISAAPAVVPTGRGTSLSRSSLIPTDLRLPLVPRDKTTLDRLMYHPSQTHGMCPVPPRWP